MLLLFQELTGDRKIHEFAPIEALPVGASESRVLGVDMNDSTQPLQFSVATASGRSISISLKFPIGEVVRAVSMPESLFDTHKAKLKGMNEHNSTVPIIPG